MKKTWKLLKWPLRLLAATGVGLGLYLLLVAGGMLWAVNTDFQPAKKGITIFVTTNGFHTDVVVPIQHRTDKCFQLLTEPALAQQFANYTYLSFGWGDRNFYMESYHGNFPSVRTVFSTLLVPGRTLMHTTFYRNPLKISDQVRALTLSEEQYEQLLDFIEASFLKKDSHMVRLLQPGYGDTDYFFEAQGKYHLFRTCNVWTGNALQQAGVKVSYWTPLESSVWYYLQ